VRVVVGGGGGGWGGGGGGGGVRGGGLYPFWSAPATSSNIHMGLSKG